jgi:hypothetical protein
MIKETNVFTYHYGVNEGLPVWDTKYTYYVCENIFFAERAVRVNESGMRNGYFLCDTKEDVLFVQTADLTEGSIMAYNRRLILDQI